MNLLFGFAFLLVRHKNHFIDGLLEQNLRTNAGYFKLFSSNTVKEYALWFVAPVILKVFTTAICKIFITLVGKTVWHFVL